MYPRAFEYFSPETLDGALQLLTEHGEEAKLLAGGQSLIPLMKLRLASPQYLIDLNRIEGLAGIREEAGRLHFGTLTRHFQVEESELVRSRMAVLHDAVSVIGDVQIRNLGTIGGSLVHADPAGDMAPALLVLDASLRTRSPRGERTLKIEELIVDAYYADLKPDEVLTEVVVPVPPEGSGGAYLKFERRAGDFAVASVGVQLALDPAGQCKEIAISMGAVGITALRARRAEEVLRGQALSPEAMAKAAAEASAESEPFDDIRGSVDYKRHLVGVLLERAVDLAVRRARGEEVKTVHL